MSETLEKKICQNFFKSASPRRVMEGFTMISRIFRKSGMFIIVLCSIFLFSENCLSQSWFDGNWPYRTKIAVTNNNSALNDFQVQIKLTNPSLFSSNGNDIRFTSDDGHTLLNFWIEKWDLNKAIVYIKVPLLTLGENTIYMYHGNPNANNVSNGDATFEFFDDFNYNVTYEFPSCSSPPAPGKYFEFGGEKVVLSAGANWEIENGGPHNLGIVEANKDGYRWWGYYGMAGSGYIGLARSNDLVNWDKYEGNPIISRSRIRWPTAAYVDGIFYLIHTEDYGSNGSYIVLETSTDGIHFSFMKTLVQKDTSYYNQNPFIYYNTNDNKWYLYWFNGDAAWHIWHIYAKAANTIEALDAAPTVEVISRQYTIAAPSMFYCNGLYYLSVETLVSGIWAERFYYSSSPITGFTECSNSPMLIDDIACGFQYQFDNNIYLFVSKRIGGSTWDTRLMALRITGKLFSDKWRYIYGNFSTGNETLFSNSPSSGFGPRIRALKNGSNFIFSDGIIEFDLNVYGGYDELGIMYRGSDPETANTYSFHPSNWRRQNQWWFEKRMNNSSYHLVNTGNYNPGQWHKVKLSVDGTTHQADVDGQYVATVQDSSFQSGTFGILCWGNNIGEIDNLRIRKIVAIEPISEIRETEPFQIVEVPNIVGLSQAETESLITGVGLLVGTITHQYNNSVPLGIVISQNPPAGTMVAAGSTVTLVISLGPSVLVPDTVGRTQAEAESLIAGSGLAVGTITKQYSNVVPFGTVISQNPSAGTEVSPGTSTSLVVSLGPSVLVPDTVGRTQAEAESLITGAGLVVGTITHQYNNSVPLGIVISQNPPVGTMVASGSTVTLVVSLGPSVQVPDVVGRTQAEVESLITGVGLVVGTITKQYSNVAPFGTVISQNPSAGTQVLPGTSVNLIISLGIVGDLNHNGSVDENDFQIFMNIYGKCQGSPDYLREADYNGDGCVNFADVQQFSQ